MCVLCIYQILDMMNVTTKICHNKCNCCCLQERLLRAELGLGENDDLPEDLFDDEEEKGENDKIEFSYAQYIESMRDKAKDGLNELDELVNLHVSFFLVCYLKH